MGRLADNGSLERGLGASRRSGRDHRRDAAQHDRHSEAAERYSSSSWREEIARSDSRRASRLVSSPRLRISTRAKRSRALGTHATTYESPMSLKRRLRSETSSAARSSPTSCPGTTVSRIASIYTCGTIASLFRGWRAGVSTRSLTSATRTTRVSRSMRTRRSCARAW